MGGGGRQNSSGDTAWQLCLNQELAGLVHGRLTSRISNLSVLTLFQVFLSRATGLMFIPAGKKHNRRVQAAFCGDWQRACVRACVWLQHSLMMAMSELKLPMLKHS